MLEIVGTSFLSRHDEILTCMFTTAINRLASLQLYRSSSAVTMGGNIRNPNGSILITMAIANVRYLSKKTIECVHPGIWIQLAKNPE